MTHIFNGRAIAYRKEEELKSEVDKLKKEGVIPKLVSLLLGDNPAGRQYLKLKAAAAKNIGAKFEIKELKTKTPRKIIKIIRKLNKDNLVHGVMIQLPFPEGFKDRKKVIEAINSKKDVDGMREDSLFLTPAVRAILTALRHASDKLPEKKEPEIVIVGAEGFVGKRTKKVLEDMDYKVLGVDIGTKNLAKEVKKADVVISTTGSAGIIKAGMVKKGVVIIDVGAPFADVDKKVYKKASFFTPVPGGIGPVTISSLLKNLVLAAKE